MPRRQTVGAAVVAWAVVGCAGESRTSGEAPAMTARASIHGTDGRGSFWVETGPQRGCWTYGASGVVDGQSSSLTAGGCEGSRQDRRTVILLKHGLTGDAAVAIGSVRCGAFRPRTRDAASRQPWVRRKSDCAAPDGARSVGLAALPRGRSTSLRGIDGSPARVSVPRCATDTMCVWELNEEGEVIDDE